MLLCGFLAMTRWEYLLRENLNAIDLEHLGEQGWELIVVINVAYPSAKFERFYFKRPLDKSAFITPPGP